MVNVPSPDRFGIALNVSRARLTVLGFSLAVNVFAIGNVLSFSGGAVSELIILELNILVVLLGSVATGTVASVLFLLSERFDTKGHSDVGIFAIAEMTMYLSLAQTLNGLSQEFLNLFALNLGAYASSTAELQAASARLESVALWVAASAWAFLAYVAPIWSLAKIPRQWSKKLGYLGYYFVLLLVLFYFDAVAVQITSLSVGIEQSLGELFFKQFWMPLTWSDISLLRGG